MRVVLDTNVLVSAFLNPHGAPARILQKALDGEMTLLLDARILAEYVGVLARAKFQIPEVPRRQVLECLILQGEAVLPAPLEAALPDPDDLPFLEAALGGRADALVTGNQRHFPTAQCHGMRVLSPVEFLDWLEAGRE